MTRGSRNALISSQGEDVGQLAKPRSGRARDYQIVLGSFLHTRRAGGIIARVMLTSLTLLGCGGTMKNGGEMTHQTGGEDTVASEIDGQESESDSDTREIDPASRGDATIYSVGPSDQAIRIKGDCYCFWKESDDLGRFSLSIESDRDWEVEVDIRVYPSGAVMARRPEPSSAVVSRGHLGEITFSLQPLNDCESFRIELIRRGGGPAYGEDIYKRCPAKQCTRKKD